MKDKVVQNNSQVKFKNTEVEDHHMISSISNRTKSITACNDSLKSRTSNVNVVCVTCGKCVFNLNHDACVSKFISDVNARSNKPQVVPIRPRKPIRRANQSVATTPNKTIVQLILFIVDSGCTKHMTGNLKLLCNFVEKYLGTVRFENDQFAPILGYEDLVQGNITIKRLITISSRLVNFVMRIWRLHSENLPALVYNKITRLIVESIHINFDEIKELSKASDYDNSGLAPPLQMTPLFEEYFTTGNQSVSQSSSLFDKSKKQDTQPTTNIQPTTEPITPTTNVNAEENNNDQAADAHIDENEFYNIFSTPVSEEAESSSRNVDNSNMCTFYQRHQSEHRWTKDHPLEEVHGNPSS
ncbi:hypothetical protein Tco_1447299 [Tanacetum coccineum]